MLASLDPLTLMVFTILVSSLLAGLMLLMWGAHRNDRCFLIWASSNASYAVGWALFVLRYKTGINFFTLPLANLFLIACPILALEGLIASLRIEVGRHRWWLFSCGVPYVLLMWHFQDSNAMPKILGGIITGMTSLAIAVYLGRLEQRRSLPVLLLIMVNLLSAGTLFFRAGYNYAYIDAAIAPQQRQVFIWTLLVLITAMIMQSLIFPLQVFLRSEDWLRKLALRDPLTEVSNRRAFMEDGHAELLRTLRGNGELSVLMLDIDHFKRINDCHGHATGDRVLKELAAECRRSLRNFDLIGRLGGEEFAVLLPQTGIVTAELVAERLRGAIASLNLTGRDDKPIPLTVSIGVSALEPHQTQIESMLALADAALYRAKESGRNRVCSNVEKLQSDVS